MKSQFIAIEGLEGAGKSTAMEVLLSTLKQAGVEQILTTREPGGTPIAEEIRNLVKSHDLTESMLPETELLLMYASRVQLVEHVIKPSLNAGKWVMSDRYELSTWAYQGGGRGINDEIIAAISRAVLQGFKPDFTLYLDIDPKLGLERAGKRGVLDRFEREALAFFERVRAKYLLLATDNPTIAIIDASQDVSHVTAAICAALKQRYPQLSWRVNHDG